MNVRRIAVPLAATALAVGTAVVAAPAASAGAPIVWHQAVAIPSATSPCPVTTDVEKAKGWTDWASSYAEWPNGGKGGNVCHRSITWAHQPDAESAASGDGCRLVWVTYAKFGDGWLVTPGSPAYADSACTVALGPLSSTYVYAPEGPSQAYARCVIALDTPSLGAIPTGDQVYWCDAVA